jgi:hypothetical protein
MTNLALTLAYLIVVPLPVALWVESKGFSERAANNINTVSVFSAAVLFSILEFA